MLNNPGYNLHNYAIITSFTCYRNHTWQTMSFYAYLFANYKYYLIS